MREPLRMLIIFQYCIVHCYSPQIIFESFVFIHFQVVDEKILIT